MQNPGHEYPFELVVKDDVWNETSKRVIPNGGYLRFGIGKFKI